MGKLDRWSAVERRSPLAQYPDALHPLVLVGKEQSEKKSYYEIVYATIIKISDDVKEKKVLEKIILCEVPNKVYPDLENAFLNLMHDSGHPGIKLEKKIDFDKLYNERFN